MKQIVSIAAALALTACATAPIGSPIRNDGFANIGEATRVGPLVVTPQTVVEDSRCPINARCVWAGRVILETRIEGPGWRETVRLELGKPYQTHGAGLALVSAEPTKFAGQATAAPATVFHFEPR